MSAIVGIDARVDYSTDLLTPSWTAFTERNEFSINVSVDVAEHKPFVASISDAWVEKARTWMSWSGSLSGYLDTANDYIFDSVVAGEILLLRFYDTRNDLTRYWEGQAVLTSVDHGTTTDDFATLSVDFEGNGALSRTAP
jgi:hypothetical protein